LGRFYHMAGEIIKVSTEELRSAVQKYTTQKTQLQNAHLTMYRNIHGLDGVYVGDASEALKQQFEEMYKNLSYYLYYIKSISILFDLKIMLYTIETVIFKRGAL
ncbi:MAG: WXG100 family type VII secretion target, partial [Spirochaetales bacterium]|nr:WXG100 family type VII secretion target [Spirochaetales bacterium]